MDAELQKLETEVTENGSAIDSAVTLLGNLSAQIRATAGNREKALALADTLDQNSNRLAAAVTANTPAEQPGGGEDTGGGQSGEEDEEV